MRMLSASLNLQNYNSNDDGPTNSIVVGIDLALISFRNSLFLYGDIKLGGLQFATSRRHTVYTMTSTP